MSANFSALRRTLQSSLLFAGAMFVVAIGFASVQVPRQAQSDYGWVIHTLEVKNAISKLRLAMRRAEIGLQNFLATDEVGFHADYEQSVEAAQSAFSQLHLITADNSTQQSALDAVRPLFNKRQSEWQESLRLHAAGQKQASLNLLISPESRETGREFRDGLEFADREEERLLAVRSNNSAAISNSLLYVNLAGAAAIVVIGLFSLLLIRSSTKERERTRKRLEQSNSELEEKISERTAHLHEANDEIRVAGELLNGAVASIPDAVLIVDKNGKTLLSNPAADELFGTDQPVGSSGWQEKYPRIRPSDGAPFPADETPIGRASRGEPVNNLEIILRHPKRQKDLYLIANGRPILDPVGKMRGAVLVYRDLTDVRETETQLRQLQKTEVIGQLTAGMAHDFNNILTVVIGLTEILIDALSDQPELHEAARTIDEAAQRGAKMIESLLAFARRQPLQPRSVSITELFGNAGALLESTLGGQIELTVVSDPDVWPAHVDSSQLTTALINLALNARQAMATGGRLTIEAGNVLLDADYANRHIEVAPGQYVLVAVSDNGCGIAPENIDRVFEPFFTTKEFGEGTGLGLSMVYGFVKQSGGHIKIYSEQGYGTTVKMYLPRAIDLGADDFDEVIVTESGNDEMILIVEDEKLVREYLAAQLRKLGYRTHAVATANEALAFAEAGSPFDLLLTDIILKSGMNGKQLSDEIAKRRPGTKLLFTSGYTENAIVHHGRLDQGVQLLSKPYRKSTLSRYVRNALGTDASGHERTIA